MQPCIHIACVSSNEYAPYTATTLLSIFEKASKDYNYYVYILTENMSPESCKKISSFEKKYNIHIEFRFLGDEYFKIMDGVKYGEHVGRLASSRLLLADLYPHLDKVISIEADMFFRDDISKLWQIPVDEYYTCAVEDLMQRVVSKKLFDDENHLYFNTGVQIMNLKKMRNDNYRILLKKAVESKGHLFIIPEQDIVNVAYENHILPLDIKWNFFHIFYPITMRRRAAFKPINEEQYKAAQINPSVIHTPGPDKLWFPTVNHPYKKEFLSLYKVNPFYNRYKFIFYDNYKTRYEKHWAIRLLNFDLISKRHIQHYKTITLFGLKLVNYYNNGIIKNYCFIYGLLRKIKKLNYYMISSCGIRLYVKTHKDDKKIKDFLYGLISIKKSKGLKTVYLLFFPVYNQKLNRTKPLSMDSTAGSELDLKKSFDIILHQNAYIINKLSSLKSCIQAEFLHEIVFKKYKNLYSDKDVALVCTGKTANFYKMMPNVIHVGVNGACYLNHIDLDYLFAQDYTIRQKNNSSLIDDCLSYSRNNCKKFFGIIPDERLTKIKKDIGRIPLRFSYSQDVSQYILEDWPYHNIAYDLSREPVGDFCGTSFSALQFILYTHPKTIYLIGWDCSAGYAYDKPNALAPANYQLNILIKYFVPFINEHYPDIDIITVNPVGLKGIFKDIYTDDYLRSGKEIDF